MQHDENIEISVLPTLFSNLDLSQNFKAFSKQFWDHPELREQLVRDAQGSYLVIYGNEPDDYYPKSMWVVAKQNLAHQAFDREMDILQSNDLISSEHQTDTFTTDSFRDFAIQIKLDDKSISFFLSNEINTNFFDFQKANLDLFHKREKKLIWKKHSGQFSLIIPP
jgi:hypothetical protein